MFIYSSKIKINACMYVVFMVSLSPICFVQLYKANGYPGPDQHYKILRTIFESKYRKLGL